LKRQQIVLWVGLIVLWSFADGAIAQDMSFDIDEAETTEASPEEAQGQEGEAEASVKAEVGGDVLSDLAGGAEEKEEPAAAEREHHTLVAEEIYAVQRIYALRYLRFELAPSIALTMNDQYISHNAPAVALNFWVTNVLAIGANFLWYQGFENRSDLTFHIGRSTRLGVPISEYQLGAHLNFTYVPIYGKFQMFNEYIFQWDSYIVGGVGFMRTRPYPVVDPVRNFDFGFRVAFNVGLGIRVFITRYLTAFIELRDYMYLERLENLAIALDSERTDPETWLAEDATLTHNVAVHVGMTIFLPFDFDYRYPK
jgi:outer membrane beta-barrel protein